MIDVGITKRKHILAVLKVCLIEEEAKKFPNGYISLGSWRTCKDAFLIEANIEKLIVHETVHLFLESVISLLATNTFDKIEYHRRWIWNN